MQITGGRLGEVEGIVEFALGQESSIAGHLGAEESEPETAVESGSKGLGWVVAHEFCSAKRQKVAETLDLPGSWRNCYADSGTSSGKSGLT